VLENQKKQAALEETKENLKPKSIGVVLQSFFDLTKAECNNPIRVDL
jgi:hypothetical protein